MIVTAQDLEEARLQNEKEREKLIAFIKANPNLRPWQAIYSWSGAIKITVEYRDSDGIGTVRDPFYWKKNDS